MKTNKKNNLKAIYTKIIESGNSYISIALWMLLAAVLVRFYEAGLLAYIQGNFGSQILWNAKGLVCDILLFIRISCIFLPIFCLIDFFNIKIANISFRIIFSVLLLLSLIAVTFFAIAGYFLDAIVFTYSVEEIIKILNSSSGSPFWSYIVIFILPIAFFIFSKRKINIPKFSSLVFIVIIITSLFFVPNPSRKDPSFFIQINKTKFFLRSAFYKSTKISISDEKQFTEVTNEFRSYFPEHEFLDEKYPFFHKADYHDVLSPFFSLKNTPPNIVFVIVEGFSNEVLDPRLDLMPFFSSLANKSLSWEQCWSTSARTYGAIPAIVGALPFDKKGFMALSPYSPANYNFLNIINKNGYENNFFYGGWYGFDNMENFMKENNTNNNLQRGEFDSDIKKNSIGSKWGIEDHLMFKQAVRNINFKQQPRLDFYLTLSTHDPWVYPDSKKYQERFVENITNSKKIDRTEKQKLISQKKTYAGFSYVDKALEQLLNDYKDKEGFDNTIFIITGDHSPFTSQLRGYINHHVPFIIWSPMLKEAKKIKGVISHRDFAPTILSMLKNKFKINIPDEATWLNNSMDTSINHNSKTFTPFYSPDRKISGILYNDYILCDGVLSKYDNDGNLIDIEDEAAENNLERLMLLYQTLDLYVCENNKLIKTADDNITMQRMWIDENDSISEDSYFTKKSGLKIAEDPENPQNKTLFFDDSDNKVNFLSFVISDELIDIFKIEVEFDIYIDSNEPKPIEIVRKFFKKDQSCLSDKLVDECHKKWYKYKYTYVFRKESLNFNADDKYELYIQNKEKLSGYLDNIKVRCVSN